MKPQVLILTLELAAGTAWADTLHTKSGETIKGRVLEQTKDQVRVRTRYGELAIPRGEIKRHERATYVVTLKNGSRAEGEIVGETDKELALKVGGKERKIASAEIKEVLEKPTAAVVKTPPKPKPLSPQQIRALTQQALAHFKKKEHRKALETCQKILASNPDNMIAWYNSACAYSLMKNKAKAVDALNKSIEAGYVNFQHMEQDTDLDGIRAEPGYQAILKNKAELIKKSTEKAVTRIRQAMKKRGVDISKYKSVYDHDRNFIYLHTKTDEQLTVVRKGLEDYAEHQWKHLFQNKPDRPLYIILLTAADSRRVLGGRAGGVYSAAGNTLFCGDIPVLKLMKTSVVVHEFTHALHFADMLARQQRHPIWLIEGLATLFEASDRNGGVKPLHSYRLAVIQSAVRAKAHIEWKTLMKLNHLQFMRAARLTYAQSRYMLLYMHENGLLKRFYDEYTDKENYKGDKSALEAFEVVFGKPIEAVERDWKQWVLKQKVPPVPFLGIQMQQQGGGVVARSVVKGGPAAKGGVQNGDVIASIDGQAVKTAADVLGAIGPRQVGETVELVVRRKDQEQALKVKLGKRRMRTGYRPPRPKRAPYIGLTVEEKEGVVYAKAVAKGSPAEKAGLKPGMPILELRGKKVGSIRDYLALLKAARPGQKVSIKTKVGDKATILKARLTLQPSK